MFAIVKLENLTCVLHHTQKEGKEFSNRIFYDHERDARFRIQHVNTKFLLTHNSFYTRISLRFNSTTGSSNLTFFNALCIILHLFCKGSKLLKLHITIFLFATLIFFPLTFFHRDLLFFSTFHSRKHIAVILYFVLQYLLSQCIHKRSYVVENFTENGHPVTDRSDGGL